MPSQMERSIENATERVAQHGYLNHAHVTDRDVILAGFGFLAERIDKRMDSMPCKKTEGLLSTKKALGIATVIGALIGGAVRQALTLGG